MGLIFNVGSYMKQYVGIPAAVLDQMQIKCH